MADKNKQAPVPKIAPRQPPVSAHARDDHATIAREPTLPALQRAAGNNALGRLVQQDASHTTVARQDPTVTSPQPGPAVQAAVADQSGGQPLPATTRSGMERALGADLGNVRIHTGSQATRATDELSAAAFATGQHVFFSAGRYQPNSTAGRSLLAHELAHTVQQAGTAAEPAQHPATPDIAVSRPGKPMEREANTVARRVGAGQPAGAAPLSSLGRGPRRQAARQPLDSPEPASPGQAAVAAPAPADEPAARQPAAAPAGPPATPGAPGGGAGGAPGSAPEGVPATEVSLASATFTPSPDVDAYLTAQAREGGTVHVAFGNLARGDLRVRKRNDQYNTPGDSHQAIPLTHPALQPLRDAGAEPVLAVRVRNGTIAGYLTLATRRGAAGNPQALVTWVKEHATEMGWLGINVSRIPNVTNELKDGTLHLQLTDFPVQVAGFINGTASFGLENETVTFHATATVHVQGLTDSQLEIARDEQGRLSGRVEVPVSLASFSGNIIAVYGNGTVNVEGTVRHTTEKLSGEVTLLVTDAATARSVALQRLGPDAVAASAQEASGDTGAGPRPGPRALAGWGVLNFAFTDWMTGQAQVIIDNEGHVTVVGEITPPAEIELFPQRDFIYNIFRLEVRAAYGVPLVGNIFVFANIGMDALAKLGPAKIYNIRVEGTYSTDPQVFNRFSIQASLNISAFAGLRMRAEGGAGIELLGHDIKIGVGIDGIAGVRGYVEATPTFGYREVEDPQAGRKGEFYIKGHMELAAQPFLGLGGDFFVELDSPWWSPAPDDKWTWPLGSLEYPLPGQFGIGADVDYVIGSDQLPEIQFGEVDFNKDKFMTDLVDDHVPPKSQGEQEKQGEWKQDETVGQGEQPPQAVDTQGAPAAGQPAQGQQQPGAGEVPAPEVQQRWLQGMKALGTLAETSKSDPLNEVEIQAALAGLKAAHGFTELRATREGEDWSILARMNPDNKKKPIKVEGEPPKEGAAAPAAAEEPAPQPAPSVPTLTPGELVRIHTGTEWAVGDFVEYRKMGTTELVMVKVGKNTHGRPVSTYDQEKGWKKYSSGKTSIIYGALDALNRPTGVDATLGLPLPKGSEASSSIIPPGFLGESAGHARGHLLGNQLGGSGRDRRNLVTLYQTPVNTPKMSGYEGQVRRAVEKGEIVTYKVIVVYDGNNPMPSAISLEATGDGGFVLSTSVINSK